MSGNTLGSAVKWLFLLRCGVGICAAREAGDFGMEAKLPVECSGWKMGMRLDGCQICGHVLLGGKMMWEDGTIDRWCRVHAQSQNERRRDLSGDVRVSVLPQRTLPPFKSLLGIHSKNGRQL